MDQLWASWREAGAKYEPHAVDSLVADLAKPAPASTFKGAKGLGNAELSRLWTLGSANRFENDDGSSVIQPSFREYIERVIEDMDPENAVEEQYQMRFHPIFQWKGK